MTTSFNSILKNFLIRFYVITLQSNLTIIVPNNR